MTMKIAFIVLGAIAMIAVMFWMDRATKNKDEKKEES
jgi:hypothetical protein